MVAPLVARGAMAASRRGAANRNRKPRGGRFKTARELAEMRRLNPDIPEEFLDSPIVSVPRRGFFGGIFGDTEQDDFAQSYTDKKLAGRKQRARQRRNTKGGGLRAANRNYAPAANLNRAPKISGLGSAALESIGKVAMQVKATATTIRIGAVMMSMYIGVQLPLYFFGLIFFLAAVFDLLPLMAVNGIVSFFNLNVEIPAVGAFGALSIGFNSINTGICLVFMFGAALMYTFAGIHWWGGQRSALKAFWFCFAIVAYSATFFQFFPWAIPWLYVVSRNPE